MPDAVISCANVFVVGGGRLLPRLSQRRKYLL